MPRKRKSLSSPPHEPQAARAEQEKPLGPVDARTGYSSVPIVGIGASAGGLDALTQLLQHLRPDTAMAFVLVQHLDPLAREPSDRSAPDQAGGTRGTRGHHRLRGWTVTSVRDAPPGELRAAFFDTTIGRLGIAWSDRGVVGLRLPLVHRGSHPDADAAAISGCDGGATASRDRGRDRRHRGIARGRAGR